MEDVDAYGEEYKKYNQMVIGRALVLTKFEEATMLWATMSEESIVAIECFYVDVVGPFDRSMADVIYHWRHHLEDAELKSWKIQKECDGVVDMVVSKVMRYMETFKAKEVELSPECKRKREAENDDVWEPEDGLKEEKHHINNTVETGGTIVNPSEMRCTCNRA